MDKKLSPQIELIIQCCKIEKKEEIIKQLINQIDDWEKFISLSYVHGIFPLAYNTLKNHSDMIPDEILQHMKLRNLNITKQNMLMTSELLKVLKILEENNILAIPFKGPVLSQIAYGDVVSRQYVDIDILVEEKDLKITQNLLESNNFKPYYELLDYQKENIQEFAHDVSMVNQSNGVNIELHWTLTSSEFFVDLSKLNYREEINKIRISNQDLCSFSNEKLLIYLCIHGYKHLWERIEWLVDIYLFLEKEKIDISKVIELSKKVDADKIVLSTLIICKKFFDMNIDLTTLIKSDKKLQKISDDMIKKVLKSYLNLNEKIHSKHFSLIHLYMLKNTKNRLSYIKSMIQPTEVDYEKVKISKKFHFMYFILRPFNILKRTLFKSKV